MLGPIHPLASAPLPDWYDDDIKVLTLNESDVLQKLPGFGALRQHGGIPPAQVVLWQYHINGEHTSGIGFDLAVTLPADPARLSGRPLTDFMLRIVK